VDNKESKIFGRLIRNIERTLMLWLLLLDEIRQDIEDAVSRMKPSKAEDGSCYFGGWARMSHPIVSFSVVEVRP